jgi:hypothetical protein
MGTNLLSETPRGIARRENISLFAIDHDDALRTPWQLCLVECVSLSLLYQRTDKSKHIFVDSAENPLECRQRPTRFESRNDLAVHGCIE